MAKLTARSVQTQKVPGLYADGDGLCLQVAPGGSKSWIFRFQRDGRRRELGLGGVAAVSLAEARDAAADARRVLAAGNDPIETRRAERTKAEVAAVKAVSFKEAADRYIAAHKAGWRSVKSQAAWEGTIAAYVDPVFGPLPVQAVDVGLVLQAIEPIWSTKSETASRVRGRIEAILDWATARGYRHGENPARWRGHLENLLPRPSKVRRVEHLAALPYPEIGTFLIELRQQGGIAARALEFAILTAARTGEAIGARWDEFNLAERLWTVPAERMKGAREHRVPLSDAALAIVENMAKIRLGDFVFGASAHRPISNMAMLMLLRRMGRADLTVHGFRSTFRDWAAERTSVTAEVAEMALAHAVADAVERAYRRGDLFQKRRQLAEQWAKFCAAPPSAGSVVPLRPRVAR
jgi:integrase